MIPTGDLDDAATVEALTFDMPPCAGDCDNTAIRAVFDTVTAVFTPVCHECQPIPFELVDGGQA